MSGYGSGGYPGQGYGGEPGRTRQRRGGGQHWDEGYGPRGYAGQQQYGDPGYDGYDGSHPSGPQPGQYGDPGYDGYDGRHPSGPQPGQYGGTRGMPQPYDQRDGAGPRRRQGGYEQRGGYDQRGGYEHRGGDRRQHGYGDWDAGGGDSSFLPGFGGQGDYDDRRSPRGGRPDGGRPDGGGPGGRGPGGRGPGGRDRDPRGYPEDRGGYPEGPRGGGRGDDWDDRNRKPRKKATRWLPRILVLTVVIALLGGALTGGLYVYRKYEARYHPPDYAGSGTGNVTVHVKQGDTAFSLAPELVQLGVVASTRAFENAAEATTNTTTGLKTGYYQLRYHMKASLAYAALLNPKNLVQTTVTVPEGKRVSQVLTILAAHTKIPLSKFETAAKDTAALGLPSYAGTSVKLPATVPYGQLEGYLFPATYAVTPHETALQILQAMVERFDVEAQQVNITQAAQSVGLTPKQLIIEASMVQAEAGLNSDMPKMARVLLNRKAKGMPYGFDSVVLYGLGKYGINISPTQAQAAGLYNNTQKTGLPPTPIDNPGDAAIQAILHPASGPWLYFLTVATGKPTEFSATCLPGTC